MLDHVINIVSLQYEISNDLLFYKCGNFGCVMRSFDFRPSTNQSNKDNIDSDFFARCCWNFSVAAK
jgi:hypothetical protein